MQAVPLDAGENTDGPSQAPAKPWWPLALAGAMALASEIVEWFGLAPDSPASPCWPSSAPACRPTARAGSH